MKSKQVNKVKQKLTEQQKHNDDTKSIKDNIFYKNSQTESIENKVFYKNAQTESIENKVFYKKLNEIIDNFPQHMITHHLRWELEGLKKCVEVGPSSTVLSPENYTGDDFYIDDAWHSCTKLITSKTAATMNLETFQNHSRTLYNEIALNFI